MLIDTSPYRVRPGSAVDLSVINPADTGSFVGGKEEGRALRRLMTARLSELQEKFYADGSHRLLVVLQATDTGGKDGTIKKVFRGVNPAGVRVASFKRPTHHELARDYLWRVHAQVPADGEITIFNRSHYEDVLVVRVHELVDENLWSRRYSHINDFERLLADEGTTIVKIYLHISRDEQRRRLQARLDDPAKHWKFNVGDLEDRKQWDAFQQAFTDMLERTSQDHAPWYVVPANRKWYRDLVVSSILLETLGSLDLQYPPNDADLASIVIP
ncbi:MAG TPA: polyphosphate kinase 2 family protein [Acidimicrobiia bacterium]|nr:polyphosphate kinase 2 family protein [Acidimicrobiia bacterium]